MGIGIKSKREPGNLVGFPKESLAEKALGSTGQDVSKYNIFLAKAQKENAVERKKKSEEMEQVSLYKEISLKNSIFILSGREEAYIQIPLQKERLTQESTEKNG